MNGLLVMIMIKRIGLNRDSYSWICAYMITENCEILTRRMTMQVNGLKR